MRRSGLAVAAGVLGALVAAAVPVPVGAQTAGQQAFAPDLVRDIQRSLNQKGYGAGPVDGVFGPGTEAALSRFQRDNSLPGAGRIDRQTLAALGITGLTRQTETAQAVPPGQRMSPRMVQDIQTELQRLGYDVGRTDGVWGTGTERALREFQRDRNLAQTGRVDERTLAALEAGGAATQTGQLPGAPALGRR